MCIHFSKATEDEVPPHAHGDSPLHSGVVWVAVQPQDWGSDKPDTVGQLLVFAQMSTLKPHTLPANPPAPRADMTSSARTKP